MCGHFSLGTSATTLAAQFNLFEAPAWTPRYNIAPTQEVLVVVADPTKAQHQARRHRWGLIPSWAKDMAIGNQLINAQSETAATKPALRCFLSSYWFSPEIRSGVPQFSPLSLCPPVGHSHALRSPGSKHSPFSCYRFHRAHHFQLPSSHQAVGPGNIPQQILAQEPILKRSRADATRRQSALT
ncbi:MAG TPA: SOS response-associated peptidase family protein [Candidatus Methylomirabilis sp.]|nr:SOS response-associated peptidase family protein [Candidatus Methylomirabilis sp.]